MAGKADGLLCAALARTLALGIRTFTGGQTLRSRWRKLGSRQCIAKQLPLCTHLQALELGPWLPGKPGMLRLLLLTRLLPCVSLQALELGSRLSGGNLNTLQDWQRAGIVVAVALVAFLGYRSYSSVSGGCLLFLCLHRGWVAACSACTVAVWHAAVVVWRCRHTSGPWWRV